MAIVRPGYNVVRNRYTDLAQRYAGSVKKPVGAYEAKPGTRFSKASDLKEKAEAVRHASGKGPIKPTGGAHPAYRGEGRAMSYSEKKLYAYNKRIDEKKEAASGTSKEKKAKKILAKEAQKREANMGDDEIRRRILEDRRKKLSEATTKIKKPGVGIYAARTATAEDLDRKGNLPTKSAAWKAATYAKLKG